MVAVEGLWDTDAVVTLELAGVTGAGGAVHLVLPFHTVFDAVTH